jgi:hypothetical protein
MLLSSQLIGVNTQPVAVLQVSVVHALLSLQTIATCVQALAVQPSVVQASLSLHDAGTVAVCTHPIAGSHVSAVQMLLSLQTSGVPAVQVPLFWHVSEPLQGSLSAQLVPFAAGV